MRRVNLRSGRWLPALLLALASLLAPAARALAPTPPMGWNSWDAYGFTIDEAAFKANAAILATHRAEGWTYAVIDEGWYMGDPLGDRLETRKYRLDGFGRLAPVPGRFPSAAGGAGLKPLADWTHARGLKFGIHIVRGIPKAAVDGDMPIAGSRYSARQAADRDATCPWDDGNYGIADNAAGQAYYNALLKQYAAWGVDFLKVDCVADHPYRPSEIRQIARAIRASGRPIVLSLSPGPTDIAHAAEVRSAAQMWRIMDDLWDGWTFPHPDPKTTFPNGIRNAFDTLAQWNKQVAPGAWPDADMLPFGVLAPHAGWGEPRRSRLSAAETRTAFTLWSIARSPLILGANLTLADADLWRVIGNRAVIALDQQDRRSWPLAPSPGDAAGLRLWESAPRGHAANTIALFNVADRPITASIPAAFFAGTGDRHDICDLWTGRQRPAATDGSIEIAAHDVMLLRRGSCPPA